MPRPSNRLQPEEPIVDLSARLAAAPAGRVLVLVVDDPKAEEEYREDLDAMAKAYFSLETERLSIIESDGTEKIPALIELLDKKTEHGGVVHLIGVGELEVEDRRAFLRALGRRREELVTSSRALVLWLPIDSVPMLFECSPDLASITEIVRPGERRVPVDLNGTADSVRELERKHGMSSREFRRRWLSDGSPEVGEDIERWLRLLEGLEATENP